MQSCFLCVQSSTLQRISIDLYFLDYPVVKGEGYQAQAIKVIRLGVYLNNVQIKTYNRQETSISII